MNPIHTHTTLKLTKRLRRLRHSESMRTLVRETRLSPDMFVLPLFVCEGEGVRREVGSQMTLRLHLHDTLGAGL